jgi:hypothetical protein
VNGCPAFQAMLTTSQGRHYKSSTTLHRARDVWWYGSNNGESNILYLDAPRGATRLPPADQPFCLGPSAPIIRMSANVCVMCGAVMGRIYGGKRRNNTDHCPNECMKVDQNGFRKPEVARALAIAQTEYRRRNTIRVGDLGPEMKLVYNPAYLRRSTAVIPQLPHHRRSAITREQRVSFGELLLIGLRLAKGGSATGTVLPLELWWMILADFHAFDLWVPPVSRPVLTVRGIGPTDRDGSRVHGGAICSACGTRYQIRRHYSGRHPICRSCRKLTHINQ